MGKDSKALDVWLCKVLLSTLEKPNQSTMMKPSLRAV